MLFHAGDMDVDVKIESTEVGQQITLMGQVLSSTSKFFDNAPATLQSGVVRTERIRMKSANSHSKFRTILTISPST